MQLYSLLISDIPRYHESTNSFPLSVRFFHLIVVNPLLVSENISSPVKSLSELIRLHVSADTAAQALSTPVSSLHPAWPHMRISCSRNFTIIISTPPFLSCRNRCVLSVQRVPFSCNTAHILQAATCIWLLQSQSHLHLLSRLLKHPPFPFELSLPFP